MKSLLVSVLSLGRVQDVLALLTNLPRWLGEFAQDAGILVHLVVRNNDPRLRGGPSAVGSVRAGASGAPMHAGDRPSQSGLRPRAQCELPALPRGLHADAQ